MNRKALAVVLVVPLLAAVVYALWPVSGANAPLLPLSGEGRGEGRTQPTPNPVGLNAAPRVEIQNTPAAGAGPSLAAPPTLLPSSVPIGAPSAAARDSSRTDSAAPPQQPAAKSPPHTLDREGIRSAIREKLPDMQDCYEAWLQQNPELGGTVALSFQVIAADGGGVVQNITIVDGGVGHRAFEGCVGNVFNELDFEAPATGTMNVTYPVMFSNTPPP